MPVQFPASLSKQSILNKSIMFFDDSKPSRVSMVGNIHFHSHTGCIKAPTRAYVGQAVMSAVKWEGLDSLNITSVAYSKHKNVFLFTDELVLA